MGIYKYIKKKILKRKIMLDSSLEQAEISNIKNETNLLIKKECNENKNIKLELSEIEAAKQNTNDNDSKENIKLLNNGSVSTDKILVDSLVSTAESLDSIKSFGDAKFLKEKIESSKINNYDNPEKIDDTTL